MRIQIAWDNGQVTATLNDTPTARKLLEALPAASEAQTWGREVYFSVPVQSPLEPDAKQVVEPGTVCFWVEGHSLAIPFGTTPISRGNECRLVTRVNVLGKLDDPPEALCSLTEGKTVNVTAMV